VTPFLGTRWRLHSAAASLLVIFAAELLKWQDPVTRVTEILSFLKTGARKMVANDARTDATPPPLADQHAIAVTIKPVACFDGMFVARKSVLAARESTYQR